MFGLSDESPILQNLMCNGSEYSLSDCLGYDLNGVSGEYCLSGDYQAGVRCVQGRDVRIDFVCCVKHYTYYSAHSNYTLLQWKHSLGEFYLFLH